MHPKHPAHPDVVFVTTHSVDQIDRLKALGIALRELRCLAASTVAALMV